MAGLLTEYLRESCGRAFAWGRDDDLAVDCYWWAVGWVERVRGPFARRLREKYLGRYHTARECLHLARESGGMAAVLEEVATEAGLRRTIAPVAGDLVAVERRDELMFGIYVGEKIAVRAPLGLAMIRRAPARAWRV
jgi:hypothetical protein